MAVKIYKKAGFITLLNYSNAGDELVINQSKFDWNVNKTTGIYTVRDGIENQSYAIGKFNEIQDSADNLYVSDIAIKEDLNSFSGISAYNGVGVEPAPTKSIDPVGNEVLNSIFGDRVSAHRIPSITGHYAFPLKIGDPVNPIADDVIIEVANGGDVSIVDSELIISTTSDVNSYASIRTNAFIRYIPGHEIYAYFTYKFQTPEFNSQQIAGVYDGVNGFAVAFNEQKEFVFKRYKNGIVFDEVIDITKVLKDGTFDPTKLNIYLIRFGYLGVAPPSLIVVNTIGGFSLAKTIPYPNIYESIHINQTHLPLKVEIINNSGVSIANKNGSVSAGIIDGGGNFPSTRYNSSYFSQTVASGTNLLFVVRNNPDFGGVDINRIVTQLLNVAASSEGTKPVLIIMKKNPLITNVPTWQDAATGSIVQISTNAIISAGTGKNYPTFTLAKSDSIDKDVIHEFLSMRAGEWVSFETISTSSSEISVSLRWDEKF